MSNIKEYINEKFGSTNRPPFDVIKLRLQLINDEGAVYEIYMDHLGNETFGIGHLVNPDDVEYGKAVGTVIDPRRVAEAFDYDVEWTLADCKRVFSGWDYYPAVCKHDVQHGRNAFSQIQEINRCCRIW